jgi:LysM repeat protein
MNISTGPDPSRKRLDLEQQGRTQETDRKSPPEPAGPAGAGVAGGAAAAGKTEPSAPAPAQDSFDRLDACQHVQQPSTQLEVQKPSEEQFTARISTGKPGAGAKLLDRIRAIKDGGRTAAASGYPVDRRRVGQALRQIERLVNGKGPDDKPLAPEQLSAGVRDAFRLGNLGEVAALFAQLVLGLVVQAFKAMDRPDRAEVLEQAAQTDRVTVQKADAALASMGPEAAEERGKLSAALSPDSGLPERLELRETDPEPAAAKQAPSPAGTQPRTGQVLSPSREAVLEQKPAVDASPRPAADGAAGKEVQVHRLQRGETLSKVAQHHGVSLDALRKANPELAGKDERKLPVGLELRLPAGADAPVKPASEAGTTSGKPAGKPDSAKPGTNKSKAASAGGGAQGSAKPAEWRDTSAAVHKELGIQAPSQELTQAQIQKTIDAAAKQYGLSDEDKSTLMHIATVESSGNQKAKGAAVGLMQIEDVHEEALDGKVHAGNDTVSNVMYAAKLYSDTAKELDRTFEKEGLTPPAGLARRALIDFGYNRGPGVLKHIAKEAKAQGIDTNNLQEYFAGKGGKAAWSAQKGGGYKLDITAANGSPVGKTGSGSVLQKAVETLGNPIDQKKTKIRDWSGDGTVDHFDVWILRAGELQKRARSEAAT